MSSATLTVINTTTDERLDASARGTLNDLDIIKQAQPEEGEIAIPNERTRVWQRLQTLSKHSLNLTVRLNHFAALSPMFEPLRLRRDKYLATKIELEKALGEMEALTNPDSRQERIIGHLRDSLRILDFGPGEGPEFLPDLLALTLQKHGVRPEHGRLFNGHGGLVSVEAQLASLQKDYTDARKQLVSALESAAAFVAACQAAAQTGAATVAPTTVSKG